MNVGLVMVMQGLNYAAPGMPVSWLMVGSTNNVSASISNPNDYPMTITLANNWTDGRFTWSTPGAVVIPAHGSTNQGVHWSGVAGVTVTATSSVSWSVAGGGSGSVNANGEHDSGA